MAQGNTQKFEGFPCPSGVPATVREIRDYDTSKISSKFEVGAQIEWAEWGTYTKEDNEEEVYLKYFATGIIRKITIRDVFLENNGEIHHTNKNRLLSDIEDHELAEEIRASIGQSLPKKPIQNDETLHDAYRLSDPRDKSVFYVGISKNVHRRYKQHLACSGLNFKLNIRIQDILQNGLLPELELIEQGMIGSEKSRERERFWIKYHQDLGDSLTNIAEMEEGE